MQDRVALRVENLKKHFGAFEVLRGVTMSISEAATHAIIGPNGAGKTTLVNVISGLLRPNGGSITLGNRDITCAPAEQIARLGLVRTFQMTSLFGDLTVRDNVEVAFVPKRKYRPSRCGNSNDVKAPQELVDLVGLGHVCDQRVDELSHGDQRLLEIAVALATDPGVLLLDEPTAGMSPLETARFIDVINSRLKSNFTIVLIEHDMDVVMRTADRISVLENGRVLAEGTPAQIMNNARVQEAYLGRP